ncbi:MAG: bifunctional diaminohydroxyphosphoribosylaminopyrimidine deaminase/5-amino-6-(5-phosphoribosylamino)uracil reductase RibD [Bacteroidota bacterium]|nr:bifunctional diaminohydroxyphosphoribosylaminopyrimidine deaminase/5-amino-6-(5-phosphoribosylamino)uracil reductase RibD [Bacteroidota bacterium]
MNTANNHEQYIRRCLELAKLGLGETAPNPMVGSVIVHNNRIIGEGYHHRCGEPHAEVNAINSVTDKSLLAESTLYVNLEPCSHFGKTPPCADLIIENRIPRVVIANVDPHRLVKGKGVEKLKNAGVEVITDVLKSEGEELNKRFFTYHRKSRPYIILKWAQTDDRFIDIERQPLSPQAPTWITNEEARILVHKWRTEEQAIMVGTNTAFLDNPQLNVRNWPGNSPLRVIIDRHLRLPRNLNIFDGSTPTLVFTHKDTEEEEAPNTEFVTIPFDEYLPEHIMGELFRHQVQSVIIEGGAKLLSSFIAANLWDEARVFTGNQYFGSGVAAPVMEKAPVASESWTEYKLDIFRNMFRF